MTLEEKPKRRNVRTGSACAPCRKAKTACSERAEGEACARCIRLDRQSLCLSGETLPTIKRKRSSSGKKSRVAKKRRPAAALPQAALPPVKDGPHVNSPVPSQTKSGNEWDFVVPFSPALAPNESAQAAAMMDFPTSARPVLDCQVVLQGGQSCSLNDIEGATTRRVLSSEWGYSWSGRDLPNLPFQPMTIAAQPCFSSSTFHDIPSAGVHRAAGVHRGATSSALRRPLLKELQNISSEFETFLKQSSSKHRSSSSTPMNHPRWDVAADVLPEAQTALESVLKALGGCFNFEAVTQTLDKLACDADDWEIFTGLLGVKLGVHYGCGASYQDILYQLSGAILREATLAGRAKSPCVLDS